MQDRQKGRRPTWLGLAIIAALVAAALVPLAGIAATIAGWFGWL